MKRLRGLFLLAAVGLVGIALSSPKPLREQALFRYLAVLDITQSMNVRDAGPDHERRLDYAIRAIRSILTGLPCGSELGLALYTANRTFLLFNPVEICRHYHEINQILDQIDWPQAWARYSEVAKGLYSALVTARELPAKASLLFLTDGHEAPPINPKLRPVFNKGRPGEVPGLIVGVGGDTPSPIPKLDANNKLLGYWGANEVLQVDVYSLGRNSSSTAESLVGVDTADVAERIKQGSEHLSYLHEGYLRQLASETALGYFRLHSLDDWIAQLSRTELAEWREVPSRIDHWLAGLALVLLSLETLLAWRRG